MTMRSVLDICVCNPLTDKFTTFDIFVKTNDPAFTLGSSRTRRRYNDFVGLKKLLKSHHPLCTPPHLPEKKKSSERFEQQFLVRRMKELEIWLYKVIDERLYFSDTSFHLFLQTNLTCKQIEAYTSGSLPEDILQRAYKVCDCITENITFPSKPVTPPKSIEPNFKKVEVAEVREKFALTNNQERADSGLSVTEPDSDIDSSSYESQSSIDNSLDSVLTDYPPVTEITGQIEKTRQVTSTGSDDTLTLEQSTESIPNSTDNCDSCETKSQMTTDQVVGSPRQRVEMGVLFSVN